MDKLFYCFRSSLKQKSPRNIYKFGLAFLWYTVVCIPINIPMTKISMNGILISIENFILPWKTFNVIHLRFVESTLAKLI